MLFFMLVFTHDVFTKIYFMDMQNRIIHFMSNKESKPHPGDDPVSITALDLTDAKT